MALRGRRARAGGGLARPAPPGDPAAGRPDRPRRAAARRSPRRPCSPRSAGCSTSPAPERDSGCSSPPPPRPTTTASSPPASSTSSASASPRCGAAPADRSRSPASSPSCAGRSPTRASSPALRDAAAARLARLACEEHRGRPLAPQADPADWWGTRARTLAATPLRPADQPVTMSASTLEALLTCPAQWFLEREAGGEMATSASQGFGLVVHALADRDRPGRPRRRRRLRPRADAARRPGLGTDPLPHPLVRGRGARRGARPP